MSGAVASRPRRIIDRSEKIARAEDALRCALSVLVVGDPGAVSVDGLACKSIERSIHSVFRVQMFIQVADHC
jgi:hypothetical protein